MKGKTVELEITVPEHIALSLAEKGHDNKLMLGSGSFVRAQIIVRTKKEYLLAELNQNGWDYCFLVIH